MQDFLTFKTFISSDILILLYNIGLFGMPLFAWVFIQKIKKYIPSNVSKIANRSFSSLSLQNKAKIIILFLVMLLCMEICWRMMFEFLIAYMQIRDALVGS